MLWGECSVESPYSTTHYRQNDHHHHPTPSLHHTTFTTPTSPTTPTTYHDSDGNWLVCWGVNGSLHTLHWKGWVLIGTVTLVVLAGWRANECARGCCRVLPWQEALCLCCIARCHFHQQERLNREGDHSPSHWIGWARWRWHQILWTPAVWIPADRYMQTVGFPVGTTLSCCHTIAGVLRYHEGVSGERVLCVVEKERTRERERERESLG